MTDAAAVEENLVECIGFPASSLTNEQRTKVTDIINEHPKGDILRIRLYPNFDATSDEDMPSGMDITFRIDARVLPSTLSDSLFQQLAIAKVRTASIKDDAHFKVRAEAIGGAVDQSPAAPIREAIRKPTNNKDLEPWSPELGGPGSFIGTYFRLRDDHRGKDYYIIGRGTASTYVQDLKRDLARAANIEGVGVTFRGLFSDAEWNRRMTYGENAARRNLHRAMANVAEAANVSITRMNDIAAFVPEGCGAPEMAVPDWTQSTYSIREETFPRTGQRVAVAYYGLTPASDCVRMNDNKFFVVSNSFDGVTAFDVTQLLQKDAAALPADTGRHHVIQVNVAPPDSEAVQERMASLMWEGPANELPRDAHPNVFRPIDAQFKAAMHKQFGWDPHIPPTKFVAVNAKLWK